MITKKTFIEASKIVYNHKKNGMSSEQLKVLIDSYAKLFSADNPRFDLARFEIACLTQKFPRKA